MQRATKMSRWMASVALLAGVGLGASHAAAADPTTMPAGKAMITVTVVDDAGKPVSEARVNLFAPAKKATETTATGAHAQPMTADDPATPAPKRARPKPLQTATTDDAGKATFKDVADGSYVVRANLKGSGRGNEKVTIADGKDATVSITLKAQ